MFENSAARGASTGALVIEIQRNRSHKAAASAFSEHAILSHGGAHRHVPFLAVFRSRDGDDAGLKSTLSQHRRNCFRLAQPGVHRDGDECSARLADLLPEARFSGVVSPRQRAG